ncbi:MAG: ExsB family protein [Verrucomicrobiales bacterium]|nr:ExsB family protein [Verrucomicrobiales bacterium]
MSVRSESHQICGRCVMDTSDPYIEFDSEGICNHCREYLQERARFSGRDRLKRELDQLVGQVKAEGHGRAYDCVIGVSGGVDSTYVAYVVKKLGLRPLAVHLDNGWNSELAVANIQRALERLGIDLDTHVLQWEEFRDLQLSMLRASTPDGEIPTDHAIRAVLQEAAARHGVRYILNGRNYVTEGISPWAWTYSALDWRYIRGVHRQFGRVPLRTFPHFNLARLGWSAAVQRVKQVGILNYIKFDKSDAMQVLADELDWRDYGGKHYESIYTRFFQSQVLPEKFGIDKRKSYLSVLVVSGQMARGDALEALREPACSPDLMRKDRAYVLKKLGLDKKSFGEIMDAPMRSHRDYCNHAWLLNLRGNRLTPRLVRAMKFMGILPRHFAGNLAPAKE